MANFFSLQDGNLTDASIYGYSLTGAEVMNNTTARWLSTTDAYSPTFRGDGTSISAVAIHLSAREANPTNDTLILKLSSVDSVITETYAISSFTSYNGSNNLLTPYSQNWQILKLTNPYALPNLSSATISLATLSTNMLMVMCSATNNNYDKAILKSNVLTPLSSDNIHIGGALKGLTTEPRTVTATTSSFQNIYIHNQGTLNFPLTSNVTLNLNGSAGLQITSDGTLNIGSSSTFIPLSTTHTINLSNTQIDAHNGGNFNVYGFPETTTTSLVSTHPIGSRVFTVTSTVSNNWRVGDILAFKPNLSARTSFDTLILSSFTGPSTFTTTSSSLCTHTGSADQFAFIPDVYNLTRNVIIQGSSSINRGTIRTIDASKTNINYVQLNNLGLGELSYDTGLELYHNSLGNFTLSGSVFYNNTTKLFNTSRVAARLFTNTPSNTYLRGLSSIGTIGTGNFTAEAWIYPTGRAALTYVLDLSDVGINIVRPTIYLDTNGLVYYRADNPSGNLITSTVAAPLNAWTHIAVSKISGSTKLFINGVQSGSTYSDSKNYITSNPLIGMGGPSTLNGTDFAWPMLGFISTLRVSFGGIYNNTFTPTWNLPNLSSTKLLLFSNPMERNIIDSSSLKIPFTNVGGISASTLTRGTNNLFNLDNTKINNNILSGTNFSLTNTSITGSSIEIKDNSILSTVLTGGLILRDVSGSINMSNNRTVGALGHGTHLFNTSLTGTYGALNYNSALQGMIISGVNAGTIVGGSINSNREGVYVDASVSNLNNVTFQNIITNNNSNVGFKVSGNNLNYLTPVTLNINGLTANNNADSGFEGYNITGNLSSIVANTNNIYGIKTSVGNGLTVFDGISSLMDTKTTPFSANTGASVVSGTPFNNYSDLSSNLFIPSTKLVSLGTVTLSSDFTVEFWYKSSILTTSTTFFRVGSGSEAQDFLALGVRAGEGALGIGQYGLGQTVVAYLNGNAYGSANNLNWNHYAFVRRSGLALMFVNGVSATNSYTYTPLMSGAIYVGGTPSSINMNFSNIRISNSAIYTTNNFTVPTSALPILPSTLYLLQYPYTYSLNPNVNTYNIGILSATNYNQFVVKNAVLSVSKPFLGNSLNINVDKLEEFRLEGSTLSAVTPLQITSTRPKLEGSYLFHNSNSSAYNLSSLALTGYQTDSYKEGITVMRENGLSGNHYKYTGAGSISFDTVNVKSPNTVSERLTPWSVNTKLRSTSKLIPINTGESLTVSVTLQRSSGYTGAAPRLLLVGNASLGYYDSVLATSIQSSGWETITGTIPASLNTGIVEVYVDCSGNVGSGYINIDSWNLY